MIAETKTLIVRGVPKSKKTKLEKIAKKNNRSVNYIMLHAIDYYLGNDLCVNKELQEMNQTIK